MRKDKTLSSATIRRLTKYYRYIDRIRFKKYPGDFIIYFRQNDGILALL